MKEQHTLKTSPASTTTSNVFRVMIGVLFITSGVLKALDSQAFAALIHSYGLFDIVAYAAPLISGFEILLGVFLLLNLYVRSLAFVTGVTTLIFTAAFAYAFFVKGIDDCGCMGNLISIPPALSFARNLFILGGCIVLFTSSTGDQKIMSPAKAWTILIIGCISFSVAGYSLAVPVISKNKLHVGDRLGKSLLHFLDPQMLQGEAFVFIFSPSCSHCWNATENIKSIKSTPRFSNLFAITFNDADVSEYVASLHPNFEIINYPNGELYNVVKEVPVLLMLKNGEVKRIFKAQDIPCGEMLTRMLGNDAK